MMTMRDTLNDQTIIDILHDAFEAKQDTTLLGSVGKIGSDIEGRTLHLGSANGNDFYAVPLNLDLLRSGIQSLVDDATIAYRAPKRPEEIERKLWAVMDDHEKGLAVSDHLRPDGISKARWEGSKDGERATAAMHRQTEEWDFRGSLSNMKPAGIETEDLAILGRLMSKLSRTEMTKLIGIGFDAIGPK